DLAGANANVSGRIEPDGTGRIEGRVTARRAAPLLDLAGPAWIGGLSGLMPSFLREGDLDLSVVAERAAEASGPGLRTVLKGRAAGGPFEAETVLARGELRSLRASLTAERVGRWFGKADGPGLDRPAQLRIAGSPNAGRFGVTLDGDIGGLALRTVGPITLKPEGTIEEGSATLIGEDISALAGLAGLVGTPPLPGQLELGFSRKGDQPTLKVKGRLAGTEIEANLSGSTLFAINGEVRLGRLSLPWLASAFALNTAAPGPGGPWSSARFGPGPARTFAGKVSIRTPSLDLGAGLNGTDASFELAAIEDSLGFRSLDLAFAGGRLSGEITIGRQGGLATLTGQGHARDVDLARLLGAGPFQGRVSAQLRFGGSGESAAGLISNLGGAGTVSFSDLLIIQADPGAAIRAADRALKSDDPLASGRLMAATAQELDRSALTLGSISGPGTLVGGTLRVAPLRAETETANWQGSLSVDFRNLTLDARGVLNARAGPKGWSGDPPAVLLGWQGPLSRPVRTLDVGALTNGLAAVVLARELDRIDTFEADQNERQRRSSQRLMEVDRRAAAEAARRAREEAARRAREDAERARVAAERAQAERDRAERERAAQAERRDASPEAAPMIVMPPQGRPAPPPGG
ncbi:MAG TPA: AsmA-like C-terminal region-containing protein, partial [Enterovirga sp.]